MIIQTTFDINQKVYVIDRYSINIRPSVNDRFLDYPEEKKILSISISKNGLLYHVKNRSFCEEEINKTVFSTMEEAKIALQKIKEASSVPIKNFLNNLEVQS